MTEEQAAAPLSADAEEFITAVLNDVMELPDRTSPDDWPEACLVEGEELDAILRERLPELLSALNTRIAELEGQVAAWMETAAQTQRNCDFYHGLVTQIGEKFGAAAKTSDDGSVQEDVLALRVPELVEELIEQHRITTANLHAQDRNAAVYRARAEQAPTSAQAHLAELRNAALEGAAKWLEETAAMAERTEYGENAPIFRSHAKSIRALKSTQEPTQS